MVAVSSAGPDHTPCGRNADTTDVRRCGVSQRIERLLALHVVLLALLVVSQTTVSPRNQLLGTLGLLTASVAAVYAVREFVNAA